MASQTGLLKMNGSTLIGSKKFCSIFEAMTSQGRFVMLLDGKGMWPQPTIVDKILDNLRERMV